VGFAFPMTAMSAMTRDHGDFQLTAMSAISFQVIHFFVAAK
jgi:hypothetical protein